MCSALLTALENDLLDLFFVAIPSWKATISSQIQASTISRSDCYSSYFVDFDVNNKTDKIDSDIRVPLEIIVGEYEIPKENVIGIVNGCRMISPCAFMIPDRGVCGMRVHFIDGVVSELEVYCLDGNKVDLSQMIEGRLTYIVYDRSIIERQCIRASFEEDSHE